MNTLFEMLVEAGQHVIDHNRFAELGIPENLIEAELFGVSKGAYTGATNDRAGLFATAHRGTLFIDEVGEAKSLILILFGNGHDKAQVASGHIIQGILISFADALSQADFLIRCEHRYFTNVIEVFIQR